MNFEFFQSLTPESAREHPQFFLDTERSALRKTEVEAARRGILMDYSVASVRDVVKWMLEEVRIIRIPVPESEPDWIRQAHAAGLIAFSGEAKHLILRSAYYLGESFVQSYSHLYWTIGSRGYIEENMPVVAGFRHDLELAPMMVIKNLFSRIVGDGAPATDIDRAIRSWHDNVP